MCACVCVCVRVCVCVCACVCVCVCVCVCGVAPYTAAFALIVRQCPHDYMNIASTLCTNPPVFVLQALQPSLMNVRTSSSRAP